MSQNYPLEENPCVIDLFDKDLEKDWAAPSHHAACCLTDGRILVAEPLVHRMRLSVLDPHTGEILRCVELQTPELRLPIIIEADPHGVWILDEGETALRLTLPDLALARQCTFAALLSNTEEETVASYLSPDGEFFWLQVQCGDTSKLYIIDVNRFDICRELMGYIRGQPVHGGPDSHLLATRPGGGVVLLNSDGTPLWERPLPAGYELSGAMAYPDSGKFVLLVHEAGEMGRDDLSYCQFSGEGELPLLRTIKDSESDVYYQAATSASDRLIFVCYPTGFCESKLLALHADEGGLIEKYSLRVPRDFLLVPNRLEKRIIGLYQINRHFQPVELGPLPPKFVGGARW